MPKRINTYKHFSAISSSMQNTASISYCSLWSLVFIWNFKFEFIL